MKNHAEEFPRFCPENSLPSSRSIYLQRQSSSVISFWEKYTLCVIQKGFALILAPFPSCQSAALLLHCMDAANLCKSDKKLVWSQLSDL